MYRTFSNGLRYPRFAAGIGGIQYSDIQKNDVIALRSSNVTKKEQNKLDNLLKEKDIKQSNAIQYQQLTKHIASSGSTENVMLMVPKSNKNFKKSINLRERQSKKKLQLTNNGVIISEKLANILNAKKGSTISLKNSHGKTYRFKVNGICEMYLGYYIS